VLIQCSKFEFLNPAFKIQFAAMNYGFCITCFHDIVLPARCRRVRVYPYNQCQPNGWSVFWMAESFQTPTDKCIRYYYGFSATRFYYNRIP